MLNDLLEGLGPRASAPKVTFPNAILIPLAFSTGLFFPCVQRIAFPIETLTIKFRKLEMALGIETALGKFKILIPQGSRKFPSSLGPLLSSRPRAPLARCTRACC